MKTVKVSSEGSRGPAGIRPSVGVRSLDHVFWVTLPLLEVELNGMFTWENVDRYRLGHPPVIMEVVVTGVILQFERRHCR